MQIVSISPKTIQQAITILKHGGTLVFPTETAYGLAADATNKHAIKKAVMIKMRPKEKLFPWIIANITMAKKYVQFSPLALKLAKKYWPGPLTIVLPKKHGNGSVAMRVSSNKIARVLTAGLGRPIISTSANLSGQKACYSATAVVKQFKNQPMQPNLVLNGGQLPKRAPSTIVQIKEKKILIVRQGGIQL